jgi:ribosomal protein S24E
MKANIEERKLNPLLERKELKGTVDHKGEATPSTQSLKEFLSKELSVDEDMIEVDKIFTISGMQKSRFWAKELEVSEEAEEKEDKEVYECEECGKEFDSKRGLSIHQSQAHKEEEDYEEVLGGTISEAKDRINDMDSPDYEKLLEVEKANKDRKGMKKFLEDKLGE